MRRTFEIAAVLFILGCSSIRAAADIKLEPNAKITLEFPGLPETFFSKTTHQHIPATLSAQLPENYTSNGKFPLFVFLNGADGGPGDSSTARQIAGPRDFVAVGLPLFKNASAPKIR
jgi:hypothetical protein